MTLTSQEFESYVPVYDVVPEKWDDARPFLVETLKKISNAINVREIGFFLDEELLSGKQFIPSPALTGDSQQFRTVLRKVIDFGALPNAGPKSVPHGIVVDSNFTLIFAGAYATDPINLISVPIPYVDPSGINSAISLTIDTTNVNIVTGVNRSNFTRCYVILEYIQEL